MPKHVYLVTHEARNNNWTMVFLTMRAAKKHVNTLVKEYSDEGIQLLDQDEDGQFFTSDFHEIYLMIAKTKVSK